MNQTIDWSDVEQKMWSSRRLLQTAESAEDFQSVGLLCRETNIAIGQFLVNNYFHGKLQDVSETDSYEIVSAMIDKELHGKSNRIMRTYVKSTLDLANSLQHSSTSRFAQASICIEATFHLMQLVWLLSTPSEAHPNKKLEPSSFTNAEALFMTDCISREFNNHPVSKDEGFVFQSIAWGRSLITIHAKTGSGLISASIRRANWWKKASKVAAERVLDELLVRLIDEKEAQARNAQQVSDG